MKNIPILIVVAIIVGFGVWALTLVGQPLPIPKPNEKYTLTGSLAFISMLIGIGFFSYLAGRIDEHDDGPFNLS